MMKPYELAAADQRRQRIKARHDIDLEKDNPGGPYGRTLAAIHAYRVAADRVPPAAGVLADLADLIALYAVGIVRSDGAHVAPPGPPGPPPKIEPAGRPAR